MLRTAAAFAFTCALVAGCGGSVGTTTVTAPPTPVVPTANPVPAPSPGPQGANSPTIIAVAAGQNTSGVDINVSAPASSPAPNAQMLGVAPVGEGGSASNVGDQIHRGSTMKVLLFGPGLSGDMTVTISGPNDIGISNVRTTTSVDNTPGVAFDATVAANAALGARTVRLRTANNDVTTFTGGLEVVP